MPPRWLCTGGVWHRIGGSVYARSTLQISSTAAEPGPGVPVLVATVLSLDRTTLLASRQFCERGKKDGPQDPDPGICADDHCSKRHAAESHVGCCNAMHQPHTSHNHLPWRRCPANRNPVKRWNKRADTSRDTFLEILMIGCCIQLYL